MLNLTLTIQTKQFSEERDLRIVKVKFIKGFRQALEKFDNSFVSGIFVIKRFFVKITLKIVKKILNISTLQKIFIYFKTKFDNKWKKLHQWIGEVSNWAPLQFDIFEVANALPKGPRLLPEYRTT